MSATGKEPSLRALVDEVVALLDTDEVVAQLDAEEDDEPRRSVRPVPAYGRLHETAAVLDWFDPQTIQPTSGAGDSESIDELLAARGVEVVLYSGWEAIDAIERARGDAEGRPRVKLASWDALLDAARAR